MEKKHARAFMTHCLPQRGGDGLNSLSDEDMTIVRYAADLLGIKFT